MCSFYNRLIWAHSIYLCVIHCLTFSWDITDHKTAAFNNHPCNCWNNQIHSHKADAHCSIAFLSFPLLFFSFLCFVYFAGNGWQSMWKFDKGGSLFLLLCVHVYSDYVQGWIAFSYENTSKIPNWLQKCKGEWHFFGQVRKDGTVVTSCSVSFDLSFLSFRAIT